MNSESKLSYFFILTFIAGIIVDALVFSSCAAKHQFDCTQIITKQRKGSTCGPDSLKFTDIPLNVTYDEKWEYEHAFTYSKWIMDGKDSIWVVSKYHCLPVFCPEY